MRKYPKITGWWVYCHITPDEKFYIGYSGKDRCWKRWSPTRYKGTALYPYVQQYGWDNIEHLVLADGLTEEQAIKIEGGLIDKATECGWCINDRNSGYVYTTDINKYKREYQKKYLREYQREYQKKCNKKPEYIIYNRVWKYNDYYPEKAIETPLEAKKKHLEYGYIPNYIKSDDLA